MDDAWMFLRYAKHYLDGNGFSWNIDDGPAYGTTSVLYLLIVTMMRGLTNWPDAILLASISFFFGLLSCLILTLLGFLFDDNKSIRKYWTPLLVIPCLLFMPAFRYHSLSGMETTLSLFVNALLACSTLIWVQRRTTLSFILCLFSGYLCFLVRPDNGLYALIFPPLYSLATDLKLWQNSTRYVLLFLLYLLVDVAIKKYILGSLLPLAFFAKSSGFYNGYLGITKWNAMTEMISFSITALPFIILTIIFYKRNTVPRLVAIGIPILGTFGYYATVVQIMGYHARFYYPALPFFIMSAFLALATYDKQVIPKLTSEYSFWSRRLLFILIVILPALSPTVENRVSTWWQTRIIGNPAVFHTERAYTKISESDLPQLSWSENIIEISNLLRRMPSGIVLAASEYGIIGATFPEITIVDLVGLNDQYIAYNGFSIEYVLSREPDIIWFPDPDYTYEISMVLNNDTFSRDYDYYPNAYNYGIAIRRKSSFFVYLNNILEEEFSRIYPGLKLSDYLAKSSILFTED